jgi:hypothetical protein
MLRTIVIRIAVLALVLLLLVGQCTGKLVSGDFRLSGAKTEVVLGSFAVVPKGAYMKLDMIAYGKYEKPDTLMFRAYRDTDWKYVQKATLCKEKIEFALHETPIKFINKYDGTYAVEHAKIEIFGTDPITDATIERNHYWYFMIDDCSLEDYDHDKSVPTIHYTLSMRNFRIWKRNYIMYGEFSADDKDLLPIHAFSMLTTSIVLGLLLLYILYKLNFDMSKQYTIHAAVLWVMGASILDIVSGFCELYHLGQFNQDGIGLYVFDALAAYFEASCDAMIMILLLSIAAGWTLPSSVITVPGSVRSGNNKGIILQAIQKLISSLSHPISTGIKGPSGILAISVITIHILLAQWGRIYNDDFDSYHDMDHLPGQILLFIRIVVGILFISAVHHTASSPKCPPALASFYRMYGIIGLLWFWSLPLWVFVCHVFLPYYKLQPYVFGGCCVLQCLSQVVLAWLVTTQSATAYHQYSRMVTTNQRDTLTDNLDISNNSSSSGTGTGTKTSSTWSIGRKAKVRLD